MKGQNILFSSQSDEWETPQSYFDELNQEFNFTLDVCATAKNKKCELYFGYYPERFINGLTTPWKHPLNTRHVAWMNPPYSEPESPCKNNCKKKLCVKRGFHCLDYKPGKKDWVKKAVEESKNGVTVVALLPARTDTNWFHDYIYNVPNIEVRFIRHRLNFSNSANSATFPSMTVIFR